MGSIEDMDSDSSGSQEGDVVVNSQSQDYAILKINMGFDRPDFGNADVPWLQLGNDSSVHSTDGIISLGFPGDADLNEFPLLSSYPEVCQEGPCLGGFGTWVNKSTFEAFVENGISLLTESAQSGQVVALKLQPDGTSVIETDAVAAQGSSGGPVVDQQGRIIGFVDAGSPDGRVTLVTPISTITAALPPGVLQPAQGAFMPLWTKALTEYYGTQSCHWGSALEDLNTLKIHYPKFGGIGNFIAMAAANVQQEKCDNS